MRTDSRPKTMREMQRAYLSRSGHVAFRCPVCGVVYAHRIATIGDLYSLNDVAVDPEFVTTEGRVVLLATCQVHTLTDVHALYHRAPCRRRQTRATR